MSCSVGNESELEKYIVDFVLYKVTEHVRLHLSDVITVRPTRGSAKHGAHLLATFWCNVLQHKLNFPPSQFTYSAHRVTDTNGKMQEILELNDETDVVQFFVDMNSGSLTISGQYVYDWFTAKFKQLLDNFDQVFAKNWTYSPTRSGILPMSVSNDSRSQDDIKADTEVYLLLEGRGRWQTNSDLATVAAENGSRTSPECRELLQNKPIRWSAEEVDHQLEELSTNGGLYDGYQYVYGLWRSVLHRWLANADGMGGLLYIASPLLDEDRLADVIDISVQCRHSGVKIDAIYTSVRCDPYRPVAESSCGAIQRRVLDRFDSSQQTYAERNVLQRIAYPTRVHVGASFTARVMTDGRADILLTGCNYHGRDMAVGKMVSVSLVRTTSKMFASRYLKPLETPAVTPISLQQNTGV